VRPVKRASRVNTETRGPNGSLETSVKTSVSRAENRVNRASHCKTVARRHTKRLKVTDHARSATTNRHGQRRSAVVNSLIARPTTVATDRRTANGAAPAAAAGLNVTTGPTAGVTCQPALQTTSRLSCAARPRPKSPTTEQGQSHVSGAVTLDVAAPALFLCE
jgi:hypothetical protein